MKSVSEIQKMTYARLAELEDGRIKEENPEYAKTLAIEMGILYDILEEDIKEQYWNRIEEERNWYIK